MSSSKQTHPVVPVIELRTAADLRMFAARPEIRNPWQRPPSVALAAGVGTDRGVSAQIDAANALLADCGCRSGQRWLAGALSLLVILASPAPGVVPGDGAAQVLLWAVAAGGAAFVGKTRGVLRARGQAVDVLLSAAAVDTTGAEVRAPAGSR